MVPYDRIGVAMGGTVTHTSVVVEIVATLVLVRAEVVVMMPDHQN